MRSAETSEPMKPRLEELRSAPRLVRLGRPKLREQRIFKSYSFSTPPLSQELAEQQKYLRFPIGQRYIRAPPNYIPPIPRSAPGPS